MESAWNACHGKGRQIFYRNQFVFLLSLANFHVNLHVMLIESCFVLLMLCQPAKAQTVYCVLNSVVGSTVLPYCCHEEQCDYRCIGLATILTNQCTLSIISRFLYKCIESDYISFTKKMSICLALFSSVYLSKNLMLARYIISKTSSALISFLLSDTCMNLFLFESAFFPFFIWHLSEVTEPKYLALEQNVYFRIHNGFCPA